MTIERRRDGGIEKAGAAEGCFVNLTPQYGHSSASSGIARRQLGQFVMKENVSLYFITPTWTSRKRAGAAPCPVCAT
jgi:hypothetical protein